MTSLLSFHFLLVSCSLLFSQVLSGITTREDKSPQLKEIADDDYTRNKRDSGLSQSQGHFFKAKLALRSDVPDDEDAVDNLQTNAITYDNKPTFLNLKNLARPANSLLGFGSIQKTKSTTTTTTTTSPETTEDDIIFAHSKIDDTNSSPFIRQVAAPSFAGRSAPRVQQQHAPAIFGELPKAAEQIIPNPVSIPFSANSNQLTFIPAGIRNNNNGQVGGFVNPGAAPRDDQPVDAANNFFDHPEQNGQVQQGQQQFQTQFVPQQDQFQGQQQQLDGFQQQPQQLQQQQFNLQGSDFQPSQVHDQQQQFSLTAPQGTQTQFSPVPDQQQQQFAQPNTQDSQVQMSQVPNQQQQQFQQFPQTDAQGSQLQMSQVPDQSQQQFQQPARTQSFGTDGMFIPPQQNLQLSDPTMALQHPFMQQANAGGQNIFQQQQAPLSTADQFNQFQVPQGEATIQDPSQMQFGQPNQFQGQLPGQFNQPGFPQIDQQGNQLTPQANQFIPQQQDPNINAAAASSGSTPQNLGTDGMFIPPTQDNNVPTQAQSADAAGRNLQQQPAQAQQRAFQDDTEPVFRTKPLAQGRSGYGGDQPGYGAAGYGGGGAGGYGGGGAGSYGGGGGAGYGGGGGGRYSQVRGGGPGFGYPAGGSPYPYGAYGGFGYGYRPYYLGYNYDLAPYGIPQPQDFLLYGKNTLHPEKSYYAKGQDYVGSSDSYGTSGSYGSGKDNYDAPYGKAAMK